VIRRIERGPAFPARNLGVAKRPEGLVPVVEERETPELALRYSNGFVTVEISYDAVDEYVEAYGDVPLPVFVDRETGDRRTFDPRSRVKVIYDRDARLREVTTRGRDGLYVRLTVLPDTPGTDSGGDEALGQLADGEGQYAQDDRAPQVVGEERGEPRGAATEHDRAADEHGDQARPVVPV
jgi:hypothetical protein